MKLDRITHRKWQALKWGDPRTDLVDFGHLQSRLPDCTHDDLRHTKVDDVRAVERKQAALFAYCISYSILKCPIAYAMSEDEDYDCVLWHKCVVKADIHLFSLRKLPQHT